MLHGYELKVNTLHKIKLKSNSILFADTISLTQGFGREKDGTGGKFIGSNPDIFC